VRAASASKKGFKIAALTNPSKGAAIRICRQTISAIEITDGVYCFNKND
jgi:hypothetical protein